MRRTVVVSALLAALPTGTAMAQILEIGDPVFAGQRVHFELCSTDGTAAMTSHALGAPNRSFRWSQESGVTEYLGPEGFGIQLDTYLGGFSDNGVRAVGLIGRTQPPFDAYIAFWDHPETTPTAVPFPPEDPTCTGRAQLTYVQQDGELIWGASRRLNGSVCRKDSFVSVSPTGQATNYAPTGFPSDLFVDGRLPDGRLVFQESNHLSGDTGYLIGHPEGPFTQQPWTVLTGEEGFLSAKLCEDGESAFALFQIGAETRLFRWTAHTGLVRILEDFPNAGYHDYRDGATPDGSALVTWSFGPVGDSFDYTGVYWSHLTGGLDIRQHLINRGIPMPYDRILPASVSNDGRYVFATARMPGSPPTERAIRIDMFGENSDLDGDGLLDEWERQGGGIDVDGDGIIEYSLYDLGARPNRKDLFLEIDTPSGNELPVAALAMVVQAFQNAPEPITLHIDATETGLITPAVVTSNGWPSICDTLKEQHFLSPAERALPNADKLRQAKARFSRYMLVLDDTDGGGLAGRAKAIPSSDFFICLGPGRRKFPAPADFATYVASKIMHEFGHTLGLHHGGAPGDDINGKPNYPSVMNYALHDRTRSNRSFWRLDYSRAVLPTIVENDINEIVGIQGGPLYRSFTMPVSTLLTGEAGLARGAKLVRLNGLRFDVGASDESNGSPDGLFTAGVVQDLNYYGPAAETYGFQPSPGDSMIGHNDWANLKFAVPFGTIRGTDADPPEEFPWEDRFDFYDAIEPLEDIFDSWYLH